MSFHDLLIHTLVIKGNVQATVPVHDPAEPTDGDPVFDDYGQPVMGEVTIATVQGRIRPRSAREVPLVNQGGAAVSTHIADLHLTDGITTACWVECHLSRYDVVGVNDAAGAGHHLTLDLVKVT